MSPGKLMLPHVLTGEEPTNQKSPKEQKTKLICVVSLPVHPEQNMA